MENQDVEIVYGRYSRSVVFYSGKSNKIYINEIVKKYPLFLEWVIQHEMSHYYNRFHKHELVIVFLNIITDWEDIKIYLTFNRKLISEKNSCELEFLKLTFTQEEKKQFEDEFLFRFPSKNWLYQKIYDTLKPGVDSFYIILFTPFLYCKNWLTICNYIICYIFCRVILHLAYLILRKRKM